MKYTPLRLWAHYRFDGNENEYKKYCQYEEDHKRVIAHTKEILSGLENDTTDEKTFTLFYHSVPPCTCAVLVRDYADQLDADEAELCKNTILAYAMSSRQAGYSYQSADGVGAAISVLPLLLNRFPEETRKIKETLLFTLFDSHPIGMSQRFSDHAMFAILQHMWEKSPVDANSLFLGYLCLKPAFDELCDTVRRENYSKNVYNLSHSSVLERFLVEHGSEIASVMSNEITFEELPTLKTIHANTLVTAFQLIPLDTPDDGHKKFVTEICTILSKQVVKRHGNEERFDYALKHRFIEKFTYFVLSSKREDIVGYVTPLLDNFSGSQEAANLFSQFVSAEDRLNKYDQFWAVWDLFYPKIARLCKGDGVLLRSSNVVHNYLLAWPYWNKDAKEWHSLKEREKAFFKKVAEDIGGHPAVLYSLSKLLNEIGSGFIEEGISWISDIVERHPGLAAKELEVNTVYYLENLVRGYVLRNRHKVRTTPHLKKQVLVILNFLLDKGSVTGYLIREDIL